MTKTKIFLNLGMVLGFLLLALLLVFIVLSGAGIPAAQEATAPTTVPVPTVAGEIVQPPPEISPFTAQDFGYDGQYLTCLTAPCVRGIDVSSYQANVDWEQVRAAGFEFVFIRAGYRGYYEGTLYPDKAAQSHYQGAKAAGLRVGCYFFSQATTPEEAAQEAEYAMELTKDWALDLPIVFDWEYLGEEYRTANVTARELTDCAKAFCDRVLAEGKAAMVYFNANQSHKDMYLEELTDYPFWLAMYTDQMRYPFKVNFWQYTNQGSVPGIAGNADINLMFLYE